MQRLMILAVSIALLLALVPAAGVHAGGGPYAMSVITTLGPVGSAEAAVGAPDNQYAMLGPRAPGGTVILDVGTTVCGPLYVYAPAGSQGQVFVASNATATPISLTILAAGHLGTYDPVHLRYPVPLFNIDTSTSPWTITATHFAGSFQDVLIGSIVPTMLRVDAVQASSCQDGQGQNDDGQGQNGNGQG